MDIFESYKKRYTEFSTITEFNLEDRLKQLPYEKGYWAIELNDLKRELYSLNTQRKKIVKNLREKVINNSPVALNKKTLDSIDESEPVEEINLKIQQTEHLIDLVESFYKTISFIGNDFKNIIDLKKLEL